MHHNHEAADLGFPRQPQGGHQPIIWQNFNENCIKMKIIDRGRVQILLCRSATAMYRETEVHT